MKTLKNSTLFIAFLMLMTTCYTYQPVHNEYPLEKNDHITIIAQGKEYKEAKVKSVTDSTLVFVEYGNRHEIKKADISDLKLGQKGDGHVDTIGLVLVFWWMFLFVMVG